MSFSFQYTYFLNLIIITVMYMLPSVYSFKQYIWYFAGVSKRSNRRASTDRLETHNAVTKHRHSDFCIRNMGPSFSWPCSCLKGKKRVCRSEWIFLGGAGRAKKDLFLQRFCYCCANGDAETADGGMLFSLEVQTKIRVATQRREGCCASQGTLLPPPSSGCRPGLTPECSANSYSPPSGHSLLPPPPRPAGCQSGCRRA